MQAVAATLKRLPERKAAMLAVIKAINPDIGDLVA